MKDVKNEEVELIIRTWESDTNSLYNFNSYRSKIKEIIFSKNNSGYIIKGNNNNTIFNEIQNSKFQEQYEEILFYIRKSFKTNKYEIINIPRKNMKMENYCIENLNNRLWYIVRSDNEIQDVVNDEDYILNENDIIKLGRKKFIIIKKNINSINDEENKYINEKDYNISEMNKKYGNIFDLDIKSNQYKVTEKEECNYTISSQFENNKKEIEIKNEDNENEQCRICYDIKSTRDNPKLRICSCKDYIHYECLKMYLGTKLEFRENEKCTVTTINCNKFNCDVCLHPYPLRFRIPEFNRIYDLIELNMPQELDYLILESLDYIKENHNMKTVHLVKLINDEITIGRYTSNDIVDLDISVSRRHAVINYNKNNGNLIIKNLSEKFGTLILIKGNIKLKEKEFDFQTGRSFIKARIKNTEKSSQEYTSDDE
jgi:hypothetical protein